MVWDEFWSSNPEPAGDEIVASIDRTVTGTQLIIADISQDDAWISIEESESCDLLRWK